MGGGYSMMVVKCERCGFIFWRGEVRDVNEVLRIYHFENEVRCPRCFRKIPKIPQKIILISKRRPLQPLVIEVGR